ncbi:16S rRNA (cytosine1402-N4)-methyltransferase [Bathymodiolus platifrons methanotrophic gill symbiont]|uniref:16S rRNA (cytosine(1402)-N(4))-methyltransferase RsmH n=1 Tax=Bathymodiolus platifrons methanotrophic gill symbiont TaxID=113268 RepID=UPI000B42293B|nr:16S rRNA (cytosine(1402)-N(4))-methyltransferase RsmH [Bathymodiolus platifrons methanotrophic gill symbiont]MCK5869933.1 16S rRNA (cytosine(1402)-N(4))-methyltransferase RsmH [Methyloprofundus sp.]TXK96148.1 16S rRNA (cytosine(1402)-N(4))-methyltransferase [Methylococcaceae bacterium CS4]TXK97770.1 16S rRNA (cytosine(1402)-N(4))-methyltransferase [Methylococcaceae bacterium CS5]TXL05790.1 16S rRNA (cytosine(1402)-N(4))-methyltransferase [Methylococcaceae bacterium CS1]TXL08140.1 16S rRNA (
MHLPVLFNEALDGLSIKPDGVYIDCTFGRGGHSKGILQLLGAEGHLLALDRDLDAIQSEYAQEMLKDPRFQLEHCCFSQLQEVVEKRGWLGKVDGVLMDFGVSSPQLDNAQRGFSFMQDGPLDMRMDCSSGLSAAEWLATVSEKDLVRVLFDYGEERFARRIANAVVTQRLEKPLETTQQFVNLLIEAIPFKEKHKHPATRSFQAVRIAINSELEEITKVLDQAVNVLASGGRMAVISFHSLEDRIVKRFIRDESRGKYTSSKLPLQPEELAAIRLKKLGKANKAGPQELAENPRSRSAVMRVAERK